MLGMIIVRRIFLKFRILLLPGISFSLQLVPANLPAMKFPTSLFSLLGQSPDPLVFRVNSVLVNELFDFGFNIGDVIVIIFMVVGVESF